MMTLDFLKTMYGNAPHGFLTVWTLPDKRTAFFSVTETASAVSYAERLFCTHDVYFGVGLRRENLGGNKRGGNDDVCLIPAFWSDIDILGAAHKEIALPPTEAAAMEFLDSLPLRPSIVVSSGNGLHVYWQFAEPLAIMTDAHRANIAAALNGWQKYVNNAAKERGWKLDNTSDLARVLRVPGGINRKLGNNVRSAVIAVNDVRYSPQDFSPYTVREEKTVSVPIERQTEVAVTDFHCKVGAAEKVVGQCAFIRYCRDNAAALTEPEWYAMVGNLALCSDGVEICHTFSKPYPKYEFAETDAKIAHARKAAKPHTCGYIQKSLGFDCKNCAETCKSPVALAVITRADEVRELLEADILDWKTVYADDYICALSYAKAKMPADYEIFKMRLKGKVNIPGLEKCVKAYDEKRRRNRPAEDGEPLKLDNINLCGAVIPKRWQVTLGGGVRRIVTSKDGENEIIACPDPVVITRRLVNLDDGKERLELSFYKDGRWKSVIGNRTQIYNKASILCFGDEGLHVTSSSASELVNYLSDYEIANKSVIPRVSSIARLGWLDGAQFFPFSTAEKIIFEDESTSKIYQSLAEKGDYTNAKEYLSQVKTIKLRLRVMTLQLQSLKDALTNISPNYSGMPKAATRNVNRLEDLIAAKMDLENEMAEEVLKLAEVQKTIRSLANPYLQAVLHSRYIEGETWDNIAQSLLVSEARVYQLHRTALCEVGKSIADCS